MVLGVKEYILLALVDIHIQYRQSQFFLTNLALMVKISKVENYYSYSTIDRQDVNFYHRSSNYKRV